MPGDYSRKIFRPDKHYSGVLMQQGKVQLDADWNEQLDIANYRGQVETVDVIGHSGVPKANKGFEIGVADNEHNLTIKKGRIYVEGLLCESEEDVFYTNQPYLPNPEFTVPGGQPGSPPEGEVQLPDGDYLVLLDAWQREITARDDRVIREVALGGPDTTTRLQTVWQVRLLGVGAGSPPSCDSAIQAFEDLIAPTTGKLNARTVPPKPEDNPCLLPPQTGYTSLENQLYRVEVQKGGGRNEVTFKWSRDNASVETSISSISNKILTVADTGKDKGPLSFDAGQWVEIVDEESTLKRTPNPLFKIDNVNQGRITLKTSAASLANLQNKKLRRWDQTEKNGANANGVVATADWIELENGIQIQFSEGEYHVGDYWLIPARTATGEIEWPPFEVPNSNPEPQAPRGTQHYFCRLALVRSQNRVLTLVEDCRKLFPPLTGICAEDICFDNDNCRFEGVETVQEALDQLCSARDLRFHNKHLHGWGIVCGLQVECGGDTSVRVRPGYAITCEGEDVLQNDDLSVPLGQFLNEPGTPSTHDLPDGDWSLILDPKATTDLPIRVEKFQPPKSEFEAALKGTMLEDIIEGCLKPLIDFARSEFDTKPEEGKPLVGPAQKRMTTFSNLIVQLTNKENGSRVYLSGEKDSPESQELLRTEDAILRAFYDKLRLLLQSKTFCTMFDNSRPFPKYPDEYLALDMHTIFGKGFQKRFRISPDSKLGFSLGAGNKIHIFDLEKNEMAAELEFPGGTAAEVQDVAMTKDSKVLYAVATIGAKDSMFAIADRDGFTFKWRTPTLTCDLIFHSIGTLSDTKNVFATAKGAGLFEINPDNVTAAPNLRAKFNALGHLEIFDEGGVAFATASSPGAATTYDQVLRINLLNTSEPVIYWLYSDEAALTGEDGIAVSTKSDNRLFVAVNPPPGQTTKHVVIFRLTDPVPTPVSICKLDENTGVQLAFNKKTRHAMVAFDDSYRVGLITPDNQLAEKYRLPVQISPSSIAASPDGKRVYVLNYTSNTITSAPAEILDSGTQIPLSQLIEYRAAVINALVDLLGGLIQYLKDCICDHFLINCPSCDENDKLYLACITVKAGKVFKVCNFSLRKYVHSFPTVEYWMSIIPIIPAVKFAIEKICCAALPGLFSKFHAFAPTVPTPAEVPKNTIKSSQIRSGITFAQKADFHSAVSKVLTTSAPGRKLFSDALTGSLKRKFARVPEATLHRSDVESKPTDDVRKKLKENRIIVDKVEAYDPKKAAHNLLLLAKTPQNLEPGTRVNLVTKDDKVMFYTVVDDKDAPINELRSEFENTRTVATNTKVKLDEALPALEGLRTEFEKQKASTAESKSVLDKMSPEVEALKKRIEADSSTLEKNKSAIDDALPRLDLLAKTLEASRAEVAANKVLLDKLTPQLDDLRTKQIVDLQKRLDAANTAVAENKAAVADALTLRQEVTTLREELQQARQTHQQELTTRDKDIAELRKSLTTSQTLLDKINERVKKLPNP